MLRTGRLIVPTARTTGFTQRSDLMENKRNIRALLADRQISKGQVKHFFTRNTSNKLELDKMTRYIDKKRTEKESQFQHSQKLLLRRYGGLAQSNPEKLPGKLEGRFYSKDFETRQRSSSFDPSKLSRPDDDDNVRFAATRRLQANSYSSAADPHRGFANREQTAAESKSREKVETRPRALSDFPPLVLPPLYIQEQRRTGKGGPSKDYTKYGPKTAASDLRKEGI